MPTPDVDIVAMPTGRVVAAGLDEAGLEIVVSYSDDSGSTWHESTGTRFADQDRPWLAAGPHNRVYLIFHNLFSGYASENIFVSTSTDGAASFGPPVPLTLPGDEAWSDIQCGASIGPWGIATDPRTGRVYSVWGARHGSGGGGCDATVQQGVGFSIEPVDRIWVAASPDGSLGSWSTSIAVDDSATRRSLGTVYTPPVVDAAGRVYIAYTETPRAYPDYTGAAVRYRWTNPALSRWSRPVTVAAGSGPGHLSVEAVAGANGRLGLVYLTGVAQRRGPPAWFVTATVIRHAASQPAALTVRVSPFASYVGTATELSGACGSGPTAGLQQGITCPRAADDYGIAVGVRCRLVVVWPAAAARETMAGTWASGQLAGPAIC